MCFSYYRAHAFQFKCAQAPKKQSQPVKNMHVLKNFSGKNKTHTDIRRPPHFNTKSALALSPQWFTFAVISLILFTVAFLIIFPAITKAFLETGRLNVNVYLLIAASVLITIFLLRLYIRPNRDALCKVPGADFFGVQWVVDCADPEEIRKLQPLYKTVRMAGNRNIKISTALSGSAAYIGKVNPYPGDVDFTEIVLVSASHLKEAADLFAEQLTKNIERMVSIDHIRYSELKIGADPATGKGLKWELSEVQRGSKALTDKDGVNLGMISLSEASTQRQMIKLDLIALVNGNWKEVTKVFRFAYRPKSSKDVSDIVLLTSENLGETIYQELYFSQKEAKLSALISRVSENGGYNHPKVMKKYRDLMDVEIAHYGALGMAENISHLKLLKRWFNKLRMERDYTSIKKLSEIFRSDVNAFNELKEIMLLLVLGVTKDLLTFEEISTQIGFIVEGFEKHGRELPAEDFQSIRVELQTIREYVHQCDRRSTVEQLIKMATKLECWIEEQAKDFLIKEILRPYADRLGIHTQEGAPFQRRDLFRGVSEGNKMHYLVSRYLRNDARVIRRIFDKGETIIRRGDDAMCCYVIVEGSAEVTETGVNAGRYHIRDVGPYILIGEIALVHENRKRTANVAAASTVEALEIPCAVFLELMQDESFKLFIEFLSTDRLLEDGTKAKS
jgi:CRP-like cAMP-binding protein